MADATFDGVNLIITLPPNQGEVDISEHVYSAWKEFLLAKKENMRFPAAFRTIGGDELTPGIDAGAYYFLQNQLGWRIRPAEQSQTVLITGNLAPEDSSLPMVVGTVGKFTNLLNSLQPITQSVEALLLAQQDANFHGEVFIDLVNGIAGTEFPAGLSTSPSNNLIDAFSIAVRLSVKMFVIISSQVTLDRPLIGWVVEGRGLTSSFATGGFAVTNSVFRNISVSGDFFVSSNVRIIGAQSVVATNFKGEIDDSGLAGTLTLETGQTILVNCFDITAPGIAPIFDCQSNVVDLQVRGYFGGFELRNFDQVGGEFAIGSAALRLRLHSTVNNGDINVKGTGEIEDQSTGSVVINTDGFVDAKEIEILHQMQAGNADISLNDQAITVFRRGSTTDVLATFSISPDGRIRRRLT